MLSNPGSFDAASLERSSPSQENYLQPNLGHGLRIWWAYYWPTSLISFIIIVVLSVMLRKAWENDVLSTQVVRWANQILPYAVLSAVSILGVWRILAKKFHSFSIALLPRAPATGSQPLPLSLQRILRVWREFIWRVVVYSVILRIAGSIALSLTIGILATLGGRTGAFVSFVSQGLMDAAVGLFVIYSGILDEEYADFRVTLVPRAVVSAAPAVEPASPNSLAQ
jgi:hypothetical protein